MTAHGGQILDQVACEMVMETLKEPVHAHRHGRTESAFPRSAAGIARLAAGEGAR